MRGRKRTPTAISALRGNPGRRPAPKNEPKAPLLGSLTPPAHLMPAAVTEWHRLAPVLTQQMRLLTEADHALFEVYCQSYARWVKAEGKVRKLGEVCETKSGNLIISPWVSVAHRAMELMFKAASELGLGPASRARIGATLELPPAVPGERKPRGNEKPEDLDAILASGPPALH